MRFVPITLGLMSALGGLFALGCVPPCPSAGPSIAITYLSPFGSADGWARGTVCGVSSSQHAIVGYIYVPDAGGWWIKPTTAAPLTAIDFYGRWSLDITTGGIDPMATAVAVFLIPRDFAPPRLLGVAELPEALYAQALAFDQVER